MEAGSRPLGSSNAAFWEQTVGSVKGASNARAESSSITKPRFKRIQSEPRVAVIVRELIKSHVVAAETEFQASASPK